MKRSQGGVREDGVDNEAMRCIRCILFGFASCCIELHNRVCESSSVQVHRNPCVEADAEDALIDALCLSRCQHLVCVDSNLAIYVALLNLGHT